MKKFVSLLLMVTVLLTMVFCMTACGGDAETYAPADDAGTSEVVSDNANPFPEALTNVSAMAIADLNLDYTGWTLSGGMLDGVEMEVEDVQSILTACGGKMQFVFQEAGVVQLVNGEQVMDGTYTTVADGYFLDMTFDNYAYYGVFTMVEETPVLIVVGKTVPGQALYMRYMDET